MHSKCCKNGCEFAKKFHLMSYANKNADGTYSSADYLYTCTKLGHTISFDSSVYKLGCATFNNASQNAIVKEAEDLVTEVDKKLDEIEKLIQTDSPVIVPQGTNVLPATEALSVKDEKPGVDTIVNDKAGDLNTPPVTQPVSEPIEPLNKPAVPLEVTPVISQTDETPIPPKPEIVPKKRGRKPISEAIVVNPVVPGVSQDKV